MEPKRQFATIWGTTWNNPPGSDVDDWSGCRWPEPLPDSVRGVKYSLEVGKEGNKHFQFAIQFKRSVPFSTVKGLYPSCHLEVIRDVQVYTEGYLEKSGKHDDGTNVLGPLVVGEFETGQGARTDVKRFKADVMGGVKDDVLWNNHFETMMRSYKGVAAFRTATAPSVLRTVEVLVLYGVSGAGKSYAAYHENPEAYRKPDADAWWDGYKGEEVIILDDFNGNMRLTDFLKVCDPYPFRAQVKGGYVSAQWTKVVITSNTHPAQWWREAYAKNPEYVAAVRRRISCLRHYKSATAWRSMDEDDVAYDDITEDQWPETEAPFTAVSTRAK